MKLAYLSSLVMKSTFAIFLIILFAFIVSACNFTLAEDLTPPPGYSRPMPVATSGPRYPAAPPDIVNGKRIYAEKCAPCHGASGMGDGPQGLELPVSVTALGLPEIGRAAIPAEWYNVVTQGRMESLMPPFLSLSDQERWDVTAYALTLSFTAGQVERGQALIQAACADCSLALFRDRREMAALSQSDLTRLLQEGGFDLPAYGSDMTDDERWDAAAYLRTLSFAPSSPETAALSTPLSLPGETPGATSTPSAQSLGVLRGKVSNGSGGETPSGLRTILHGLDQDAAGALTEAVTLETTLRPDGTFTFENVPLSSGRTFVATLEYGGVEYLSSMVTAGATDQTLDMTVYEPATDSSALSVDRWHIFLSFDRPGVVQVIEMWIISNLGNHVVVPAAPESPALSFTLPEDAINLQFQDGQLGDGRYLQTPNGFGDLRPILPGVGQFQAVFAYDLPYSRRLKLSRPTDLPVFSALVMVPKGVRVKSDLLQEGDERLFNGTTLIVYRSQPLLAGSTLDLEIAGMPRGSTTTGLQSLLLFIGVLGVALILTGGYIFWRGRASSSAQTVEGEFTDRDSVLDAIIALDDLHTAGKLSDKAYYARRAELKSRLRELL